MGKKLTHNEWIKQAKKKWNDLYDYSKAEYKSSKEKLTVICKKHGPWQVMPVNHVSGGKGCPICGLNKNKQNLIKPVEKFLEEARAIHGNLYKYDLTNYQGAKSKIEITCEHHGLFLQSPEVHLRPSGCPKCSKNNRSTYERESSITDVQKRINDASDGIVSIVKESFSNINSKSDFHCKIHGFYKRLVNSALYSKHPCLICAKQSKENSVVDISVIGSKIIESFGKLYSFKIIASQNLRNTKIQFICNQHGEFIISYSSLAKSPGCPTCSRLNSQSARKIGLQKKNAETLKYRTEQWINRATQMHGEKFDYSEVKYFDAKTPVIIICPTHGQFKQIPDTHLKSGCRLCADEDLLGKYSEKYFTDNPSTSSQDAILYYIKFIHEDEIFYKVGITTTSVKNRFSMTKSGGIKVDILSTTKLTLIEAFRAEQIIQNSHGARFRYKPIIGGKSPRDLRIGPTECFSEQLPNEIVQLYFR
jgi:hypothetical protein